MSDIVNLTGDVTATGMLSDLPSLRPVMSVPSPAPEVVRSACHPLARGVVVGWMLEADRLRAA